MSIILCLFLARSPNSFFLSFRGGCCVQTDGDTASGGARRADTPRHRRRRLRHSSSTHGGATSTLHSFPLLSNLKQALGVAQITIHYTHSFCLGLGGINPPDFGHPTALGVSLNGGKIISDQKWEERDAVRKGSVSMHAAWRTLHGPPCLPCCREALFDVRRTCLICEKKKEPENSNEKGSLQPRELLAYAGGLVGCRSG